MACSSPSPFFLSKTEACKSLGISLPGLNRHLKTGKIPSVRLGSRILIPVAYIEQLSQNAMASVAVSKGE